MALPLKSGADLYNNQALRMRLHNLGADPTEVGAGLIYFNTSTGLNTSQKARLYTGSAWKTIAFSEDLDVASNADFLALKDKVDTLIGDGVDMDGIIESWKEVEAFLSGMSDTKSLMDLLNGKLNTSGGILGGNLYIGAADNTSYLYQMYRRGGHGFRINNTGSNAYMAFGELGSTGKDLTVEKVLEFGDGGFRYSSDGGSTYNAILTSAGGKVKDLAILGSGTSYLAFEASDGTSYGSIGVSSGHEAKFWDGAGAHTLLHSGNIGSQIVEGINNHSGEALDVQGNIDNLNAYYSNGAFKLTRCKGLSGLGTKNTDGIIVNWPLDHKYGQQWYIDDESHTIQVRYVANAVWSAWKTIAFTDSDITGNAAKLKSPSGLGYANADGSDVLFGYTTSQAAINTCLDGYNLYLRYGTNHTTGLLLNSSGNVTIGASDLAGSTYKLVADGNIKAKEKIVFSPADKYFGELSMSTSCLQLSAIQEGVAYLPIALNPNGGNVLIGTTTDNGSGAKLQVNGGIGTSGEVFLNLNKSIRMKGSNGTDYNVLFTAGTDLHIGYDSPVMRFGVKKMFINSSGNVGIGTIEPDEKLHVVGNLHVTGNIIADGEVSAGGAAEEGGNAGGGGAFHSESIAVGATQTTIAHGLGTDDIVVSIYEKDGVSGRWSIILTDVEIVDANNIIVSFGSATSVEHKVVIMGAVA